MSILISLLMLAVFAFGTFGEKAIAEVPTTDQVRQSVQRSLPYIEEQGVWWIEEKDCTSCHRANTMIWSLNVAEGMGFKVSSQREEWSSWVVDELLGKNDEGNVVGLSNKEGVAQTLLGLEYEASFATARQELAKLLLDGQQEDGSWKAGGQLPTQKRPAQETDTVSTLWISLALARFGEGKESQLAIERAMKFIDSRSPGKSTEQYVVRLLLAVEQADKETREQLIKQLGEMQHEDGGWGWLVQDPSDALGTGLALYALSRAGVAPDDPRLQNAQRYLVDTQLASGAWEVKGTKARKKDQIQETATYWGTTWATLGLMASLPK